MLKFMKPDGNEKQSLCFPVHSATNAGWLILEKAGDIHQGEPLLSQEEWRALKEICKTT